jgi:electron transfer flavoprotein alpha subunit
MDESEFICSINTDPEAPIKDFSDVYINGDLFEVIPRLVEALQQIREGDE